MSHIFQLRYYCPDERSGDRVINYHLYPFKTKNSIECIATINKTYSVVVSMAPSTTSVCFGEMNGTEAWQITGDSLHNAVIPSISRRRLQLLWHLIVKRIILFRNSQLKSSTDSGYCDELVELFNSMNAGFELPWRAQMGGNNFKR